MLGALRDLRQRDLKRGQWQTECRVTELSKHVKCSDLQTLDLFSSLVREGYVRGKLRFDNLVWPDDGIDLQTTRRHTTDENAVQRRMDSVEAPPKVHRVRAFAKRLYALRAEAELSSAEARVRRVRAFVKKLYALQLEAKLGPDERDRLHRVRTFVNRLSESETVVLENITDKGLEQIDGSPKLNWRTDDTLAALHGLRQRDLKGGRWRTECQLRELGKVVGLDALRTAIIFSNLVNEGYVRGHLLYYRAENTPVAYTELSERDKRSTFPVRAAIEDLTAKGLIAIDELPDSNGQYRPPTTEAGAPEVPADQREKHPEDVTPRRTRRRIPLKQQRPSLRRPEIVSGQPFKNLGKIAVYNIRKVAADFREKAVEPAAKAADYTAAALAPVLGALVAFVGALIPLAYPLGFAVLWMQLSHEYTYGSRTALYAASVAPSAMVVGKVGWILLFSLFSALLPMWIWYAYARAKAKKSFSGRRLRHFKGLAVGAFVLFVAGLLTLLLVFSPKTNSSRFWLLAALAMILGGGAILLYRAIWKYEWRTSRLELTVVFVGSAAAGVFLAERLTRVSFIEASFESGLRSPFIWAFLGFTVAEVALGGAILVYRVIRQNNWEGARNPRYLMLAVVYVGSIAAGVCLSGLQIPSLPTVILTVKQSKAAEMEAGLLSNSASYWYVVDYCNTVREDRFLAIPNAIVEDAEAVVDEPITMKDERKMPNCPPETTIESGPSRSTVTGPDPEFEFTSNEKGSTFECSIDGADYKSCVSPKDLSKQDYSKRLDGVHTFSVKAKDTDKNEDHTPTQRIWTVDATGPDTSIKTEPPEITASKRASFRFASPETGATFQCSRDGAKYESCASPKEYLSLSESSHTFEVRAKDDLGNVDALPATRIFTIDTVDPDTIINLGPSGKVARSDARFFFSSLNEKRSTNFKCALDGKDYASCTSPKRYPNLSDGDHTFSVKAIDAAGNADNTPAQRTWTIC